MAKSNLSSAVPEVRSRLTPDARLARGGVAYGVAAFLWWGLIPLYFKAVASVPASQVLAHRILWSAVIFTSLLAARGGIQPALATLRSRRTLITLAGSTLLVASNWLIFIWAVAHHHVLQASLGYFINPLVNVLLGYVFLHERLRTAQKLSVALTATGVMYLTIAYGEFPTVALALAMTFGLYGLLRKTAHVDSVTGLAVETGMLAPLALLYLLYAGWSGTGVFLSVSRRMDLLLALSGVVTAIPLIWFVNAARRLRLSTVGLLQYLAPTTQFLLAVIVFGEAFTEKHLICFGLVWSGLALYALDTVRATRRQMAAEMIVAQEL